MTAVSISSFRRRRDGSGNGTEPPNEDRFGAEPFPTLDLKAMLTLPAPRWLIRNLLPETGLALIFGESNTFKSFVAIDLCCHIAHGLDWCGNRVEQGAVLYLAGEGGHGVARLRIPAWHQHNGRMDTNPPLRLVKIPVDLTDTASVNRLLATVRQLCSEVGVPVRLVVIDTLARSFSGDENSGEAMAAFINGCSAIYVEFGCVVLVVHHSGWGDKGRSRGHSSLWGATDCRIKATSDPDELTACIEVERQKDGASGQRYHMKGYVIDLGTDDEGEPINSLVFKAADGPAEDPADDLSENQKRLRDVLVQSNSEGYTFSEWLEKCQDLDKSKKMQKSSFGIARKALIDKGFVRQEGDRYFLVLTTPG
jgi:hypothetical protein